MCCLQRANTAVPVHSRVHHAPLVPFPSLLSQSLDTDESGRGFCLFPLQLRFFIDCTHRPTLNVNKRIELVCVSLSQLLLLLLVFCGLIRTHKNVVGGSRFNSIQQFSFIAHCTHTFEPCAINQFLLFLLLLFLEPFGPVCVCVGILCLYKWTRTPLQHTPSFFHFHFHLQQQQQQLFARGF